ncbi:MAG: CHAT domain-containing protein [Longimicrobiales bacterium]
MTNPSDGKQQCMDDERIASFIDGNLHADERAASILHLATCRECRRTLTGVMSVKSSPQVQPAIGRLGGISRTMWQPRWVAVAGLAAAASIALLIAVPRAARQSSPDVLDSHRGPTITATDAPSPYFPLGDSESIDEFAWSVVDGADRYRVTVFDAEARLVFETETSDTIVALPDSVTLLPGASYLWEVEARSGIDRWTPSELVEFRLITPQQSVAQPDSLHVLAARLPPAELARVIRSRPLDVREAIAITIAAAARAPTHNDRAKHLDIARRIATAYAVAWKDPFLTREVARVTAWTNARLSAKVAADSIRVVGGTAYGTAGPTAAIAIWRRSLARSIAISDTAGMAASLGNIGAALARNGNVREAAPALERSRKLAAAIGDIRAEANSVSELAGLAEEANPGAARQYYVRAVALRERIGDSRGLAADYNNMASLARRSGDAAGARTHLEAALQINRREGKSDAAATNLINLASLAALDGNFAQAAEQYSRALSTWRALRLWPHLADGLRGAADLELRRGDYIAAERHLVEALALYERVGLFPDAIRVMQTLAAARAAQGDLQKANDLLTKAQQRADSGRVEPGLRAALLVARADLARQFNAASRADELYAKAQQTYRKAGDSEGESDAQQGRALLFLENGDTTRARELLGSAMRTQRAAGDNRAAAISQMLLGDVAVQRGDTVGARRALTAAASELQRLGDPVASAAALGERAVLEASAGLPAAAESLLREALSRVAGRVAPAVTWQLHAALGALRRDRGAVDEAARELGAAIADIERSGGFLALPERRSAFLADKWDVYVQLAALEQRRGRTAVAFDISERLRAGEMRESLARGQVSASVDNAGALATREQDLRRRIAELSGAIEVNAASKRAVRGPPVTGVTAVSREALLRAEASYAELLTEMRDKAPRHAAALAPARMIWRDVAAGLAPDEALIEYLLSDSGSYMFVITRERISAITLYANRQDIARLVDFVRGTLTPRGTPRLDSLWRAPLEQLYRDLLLPAINASLLNRKTKLTFVPHAELHYLPFAALISDAAPARFLVEQYDIAVTPSASVWLSLRQRAAGPRNARTLALAPTPDGLPASLREVNSIARITSRTHVLKGAAASESAFRSAAAGARIIHLATYGVLNRQNPLFSYVQLAPEPGSNGRVEAHEVLGMKLSAELVVLAACQTGLASGALADVPAGDDWIGLARAFLTAGASRVMGSLWPVQDQATSELMQQFYRTYNGSGDAARSLSAAQRSRLRVAATSNPYFWAGFEVIGGQ